MHTMFYVFGIFLKMTENFPYKTLINVSLEQMLSGIFRLKF